MDQSADQAVETAGRILIVDDVADNRAILSRRFQKRGFEVAEAESGAAALAAVERELFDVVLLDVMMPDMNGLEVLGRIREHHDPAALPVIMVTGRTDSQDVVNALSSGANDYITKPVDFAVALARVSTQADRRRAVQKAREAHEELERANEDLERRIAERTAEIVTANAQLRVAMAEAEAANKAKDEFLVIVSHELRTPLNGMIPMGKMLANAGLNAQQQKLTDIINASAEQLQAVVTDLLDTLDLNSGGLLLSPAPVGLGELVREAAGGVADRAAKKGLALKVEIDPRAEGPVVADAARLRQVLGKILDNGVKFTEAGEVALSVRRAGDDRVVFTVSDTGVGFEPALAHRLFRPFEQADGSLTRRFGGVGLGLAICRGLVDLMGGAITAEGRPGEGATFTVELPLPCSAEAVAA